MTVITIYFRSLNSNALVYIRRISNVLLENNFHVVSINKSFPIETIIEQYTPLHARPVEKIHFCATQNTIYLPICGLFHFCVTLYANCLSYC